MSDTPRRPVSPVVKLFGAMLMAVGGLIAVLSGLCSMTVLVVSIQNSMRFAPSAGGSVTVVLLILLFGGGPFVVGVGVFMWGRIIYRGN